MSFMFVIVCGLFERKRDCVDILLFVVCGLFERRRDCVGMLLFAYICIAITDQCIKRRDN